MPIFFLIAGFFSFTLLQKKEHLFLSNRTKKLLVPLILFFLIIVCPLKVLWLWSELWTQGLLDQTNFFKHVTQNFLSSSDGVSRLPANWAHLWFLMYLYIFSIWAFFLWRPIQKLQKSNLWVFTPSLTLLLVSALLMEGPFIDEPFVIYPKLSLLSYYGGFFLFGLIGHHWIKRKQWNYLTCCLALFIGIFSGLWTINQGGHLTFFISSSLCLVYGLLGTFSLTFKRPHPQIMKVVEASYFIYLFHLPVVCLLQIGLYPVHLSWLVKWPLVSIGSFLITYWAYRQFVQATWLDRFLNGHYHLSHKPR